MNRGANSSDRRCVKEGRITKNKEKVVREKKPRKQAPVAIKRSRKNQQEKKDIGEPSIQESEMKHSTDDLNILLEPANPTLLSSPPQLQPARTKLAFSDRFAWHNNKKQAVNPEDELNSEDEAWIDSVIQTPPEYNEQWGDKNFD